MMRTDRTLGELIEVIPTALRVLERIREKITATMTARGWPVTLSVGVCHCDDPAQAYIVEKILSAANRPMYEGKQQGKNLIRIAALADEPD